MPSITVRDIPETLFEEFKQLARMDHRSLNAEIITAMERTVEEKRIRRQRQEALNSIMRRSPEKPVLPVDGAAMLREDRDR